MYTMKFGYDIIGEISIGRTFNIGNWGSGNIGFHVFGRKSNVERIVPIYEEPEWGEYRPGRGYYREREYYYREREYYRRERYYRYYNMNDEQRQQAVGEFVEKLHEARENGRITKEEERELFYLTSRHLVSNGVKKNELSDYMVEAVRKKNGGNVDYDREEEIEKMSVASISRMEVVERKVRQGQSMSM